jgi:hypothetical protein
MKIKLYPKPYKEEVVSLANGDLNVIRPYVGVNPKEEESIDDKVTLVVNDEDNSFWPCIAWLEEHEALKLAEQLIQAAHFHHDYKEQLSLSLRGVKDD